MNRSTPGLPVHHQLPDFTQTHGPLSQWCHPAISSSVVPFSCPQSLLASELPEPAGKVDQVPRMCTKRLRKNTTAKMGSRGSDTSPQREAVWPRLYSASYIYIGEREKDKTVNILLGWPIHLTKSHKKSWEHGNGTLLLFLTPDNISLCMRSLHRTPGVYS